MPARTAPGGDQPDQVAPARPPAPQHPYPLLAAVLGQLGYGRDLHYAQPVDQPAEHEFIAARFRHPLARVLVVVVAAEPVGGETHAPIFVSSVVVAAHRPMWTDETSPRWEVTCGAHVPLHLVRHVAAAAAAGE